MSNKKRKVEKKVGKQEKTRQSAIAAILQFDRDLKLVRKARTGVHSVLLHAGAKTGLVELPFELVDKALRQMKLKASAVAFGLAKYTAAEKLVGVLVHYHRLHEECELTAAGNYMYKNGLRLVGDKVLPPDEVITCETGSTKPLPKAKRAKRVKKTRRAKRGATRSG